MPRAYIFSPQTPNLHIPLLITTSHASHPAKNSLQPELNSLCLISFGWPTMFIVLQATSYSNQANQTTLRVSLQRRAGIGTPIGSYQSDGVSAQTGFTHISTISGPNRLKFGGYKIHVWYFLWYSRQGGYGSCY